MEKRRDFINKAGIAAAALTVGNKFFGNPVKDAQKLWSRSYEKGWEPNV